jgi:hypothetical protein
MIGSRGLKQVTICLFFLLQVTEMPHSYKTIKESAMPTWFEDVCAHPCNQEAYRDFTFVNPNYGAGQGQVQRR